MSKIIHCFSCGVMVGEVRDARLMKDLRFLCRKCYDKQKKMKEKIDMPDIFKNIFK